MSRYLDRIRVDADTCHGQPRVAGTRIMVHLVLELLETLSPEEIIRDHYPQLTPQDVEACLAFAATMLRDMEYVPFNHPDHERLPCG